MRSTEEVVCLAVVLIALGFFIQYLINPYLHGLGVRRSREHNQNNVERTYNEEEEKRFREEIWKMADEKNNRSRP